jgi:hypothetical protein
MPPISLTDSELTAVMDACRPLQPRDRDRLTVKPVGEPDAGDWHVRFAFSDKSRWPLWPYQRSRDPSYRFFGLMQHDRGLPKALPRCPQDGGLPSACDSRKVTGRVSGLRRTGLRLAATTVKAIPTVSPGQRKGGSVSASPAKRSLGCSERCIRNLAARQG